jgi:hypothetical protein
MAGKVSQWDREYMKRLGAYVEEANREADALYLGVTGRERLVAALRMVRPYTTPERALAALEDDDPSEFYARARRLGFIKA